jgi:hypothetical protein
MKRTHIYEHPDDLPWSKKARVVYLALTSPEENADTSIVVLPFRKGGKSVRIGPDDEYSDLPTYRVPRELIDHLLGGYYIKEDSSRWYKGVYRRTSPAERWARAHVSELIDQVIENEDLTVDQRDAGIWGYEQNTFDTMKEKGYSDKQAGNAVDWYDRLLEQMGIHDSLSS